MVNEILVIMIKRIIFFFSPKGLHLDEETRDKVKELKKKLSDLQLEFSKNVSEENSKFPFKLEELGKFFCL
jgi:thimet oligopeptidase